MGIKRIRKAVEQSRLDYTTHSLEEMDIDDLTIAQIRGVLLYGRLVPFRATG